MSRAVTDALGTRPDELRPLVLRAVAGIAFLAAGSLLAIRYALSVALIFPDAVRGSGTSGFLIMLLVFEPFAAGAAFMAVLLFGAYTRGSSAENAVFAGVMSVFLGITAIFVLISLAKGERYALQVIASCIQNSLVASSSDWFVPEIVGAACGYVIWRIGRRGRPTAARK